MPQELFGKHSDDSLDKHLYDAGMAVAKERIKRSHFFICIVPPEDVENKSLLEQIDYAKSLNKPMYAVLYEGSAYPSSFREADIRAIEYATKSPQSMEEAARRLMTKVAQDFPQQARILFEYAPDLNGIVNWPPEHEAHLQ